VVGATVYETSSCRRNSASITMPLAGIAE
jgi:hypothetical protein